MAEEQSGMAIVGLVAEHHRGVYQYAYRLSGSAADAEDLTQQTFLVAQQKLDQLRDPRKARPWLFAILRNTFLKDRQRPQPIAASDLQLNVDSVPAAGAAGEEIDTERLQQALDELSDGFRLVVVMFYFEECSYREIAERLDLPMGTVMSRLARAKGHLRARLFERQPLGKR